MGGRDGQFSPNLVLLFRAVVGSIARRVLVVKSSRSFCTVRRLFPTPGDTLPASPLIGFKITMENMGKQNVMSAEMFVSLLGVGTVLRLEWGACWSSIKSSSK